MTATLNGHGHTDSTPGHYEFQYATASQALGTGFGGQTPSRGPIPPNTPGKGRAAPFQEKVGGLSPGTTYFYRACGGDGQVHPDACAATQTFKTASTPVLTPYSTGLPSQSYPAGLVTGPDGALWFTDQRNGAIGRVGTDGAIIEYPLSVTNSLPVEIAGAFDGALWFTDPGTNSIGRITTSGRVTEYPLPTAHANPSRITSGPDTALWFTERNANKIGRITLKGQITEYPLSDPTLTVGGITGGPDGAVWFAEPNGPNTPTAYSKIGRITTNGRITTYPAKSGAGDITKGPDGALWFTTLLGGVGRITTNGTETFFPGSGGGERITQGPDHALWVYSSFCVSGPGCQTYLSRITTDGKATAEGSIEGQMATAITAAPDGALWLSTVNLYNTQGVIYRAG